MMKYVTEALYNSSRNTYAHALDERWKEAIRVNWL